MARQPDAAGEPSPKAGGIKVDRRVWLGIAVAVLVIAGVVVFVSMTAPPSGTTTMSTSTSISSGADAIVASAAQSNPAGFVLESSKQPASRSSDWAILQQSDGSEANVTVMIYSSTNASQAYFDRLVAGVKGLPGYTDVTSDLASFQQYGKCYGYGEDIDNIAVINGVCTKGNAFLQVHLVSGIAFSDLEADLTSIMGALYQSADSASPA
jgi:hypothetical protein